MNEQGLDTLLVVIRQYKAVHDLVKHNKAALELLRESVDLLESCLMGAARGRLPIGAECLEGLEPILWECVELVRRHTRADGGSLMNRMREYLRAALGSATVAGEVEGLLKRLHRHSHHLRGALGLENLAQMSEMPTRLPEAMVQKDERHKQFFFQQELAQAGGAQSAGMEGMVAGASAARAGWAVRGEEIEWDACEARRQKVGEGGMGALYKARWKEQDVAVRVLPEGDVMEEPEVAAEFFGDVDFFTKLSHKNVARLHGVRASQPYLMVMELAACGNLHSLHHGDHAPCLSWLARAEMLMDGARGLAHLHSLRLSHKNLKSEDMLVFPDRASISGYAIKVSDFGMATTKTKTRQLTRFAGAANGGQPLPPPEYCEGFTHGLKSDIFSFGVVMYELAGRRPPTSTRYRRRSVDVDDALSLERYFRVPPECPGRLRALMARCCVTNPYDRPGMGEVARELEGLVRSLATKAVED